MTHLIVNNIAHSSNVTTRSINIQLTNGNRQKDKFSGCLVVSFHWWPPEGHLYLLPG